MISLKQSHGKASGTDYHGFKLQPGYWSGYDDETKEYVASSGWEVGSDLALYRCNKETGEWEMSWLDQNETEVVATDFNAPNLESKKPFHQWLQEDYGISPEEYDEHYCGTFADEVESDYEDYCYDGLPLFARTEANITRAREMSAGQAVQSDLQNTSNKIFTYRDGFNRSIAPYMDGATAGNLAAIGSAFQALNADRSMIDADIDARKAEYVRNVSEKADTLLFNCYQLLRGNGMSALDAKRIVSVYVNDPDFFAGSETSIPDGVNKKELEVFKNRYAELRNNGFSSVITEAINVLSMGVNAEQAKAVAQIEKAAELETKAYEKEYMNSLMHVYSIGRESGLTKDELLSVFPSAEQAGIRDTEVFFDGLESAFNARQNEAALHSPERAETKINSAFVEELQAFKESCREKGISEDSLEYELQLEGLYEKYQTAELDTTDTTYVHRSEEVERE